MWSNNDGMDPNWRPSEPSPKSEMDEVVEAVADIVKAELHMARKKFPAFNSEHEGYAVLKEEVDELWEAVRLKQSDPSRDARIKKEAVQVAAMAMRFIVDRCVKD